MGENDDALREHVYRQEITDILRERARSGFAWDMDMEFAAEEIDRLRAALDKITKHPDTPRLVMQIACEALEGREG